MPETIQFTVTAFAIPIQLVAIVTAHPGRPATRWEPEEPSEIEVHAVAPAGAGLHPAAIRAACILADLEDWENEAIDAALDAALAEALAAAEDDDGEDRASDREWAEECARSAGWES